MRLTHLKLAGFKSFVDPTTIHLHGQRVGVVGPNGCGKSNVMESVRWVLGESSAKEMRADAMDAVIFNGSAQRKAISRASVELIFDNSQGGAGGEWNQYAEISVKRVIEREKGSTYYINNTAVRRRDVADLFLGTGLGGRAYAIIGQNTISRIVEAKPEELRVFLEEAAGISKYKERRRETELRLRDTRENLARVEDILREMQKQIVKLEAQAQITQRYHALKQAHARAEGQWWWLRKRDALIAYDQARVAVDQAVNALEAQTAVLRQQELLVEQTRLQHQSGSTQLHEAQAAYYACHAQVSNLSLQVQQSEEARERLLQQVAQVQLQLEKNQQLQHSLEVQSVEKTAAYAAAQATELAARAALDTLKALVPTQASAWQQCQTEAQQAEQAVLQHRQQIQLERNQGQFLERQQKEAAERFHGLEQSLSQWTLPDIQGLAEKEALLVTEEAALTHAEQWLQAARQTEQTLQIALQGARAEAQAAERAFHQAQAQQQALEKQQRTLSTDVSRQSWLQQTGLTQASRLWQNLTIDRAWQPALEALLGSKLNAYIAPAALPVFSQRPDTALAVFSLTHDHHAVPAQWAGLPSLLSVIHLNTPDLQTPLASCLAGIYLLSQPEQLPAFQAQLPQGYALLTPSGDLYYRYGVVFHGNAPALQGVLEREAQLAELTAQLPTLSLAMQQAQQQVHEHEAQLQRARTTQQAQHQAIKQHSQTIHQWQLEITRLQQAHREALARQQSLQRDTVQAKEKLAQLNAELIAHQARGEQLAQALPALEQVARAASQAKVQTEQIYFDSRDALQAAEKNHQAQEFQLNMLQLAVSDLSQKAQTSIEEGAQLQLRLHELQQALAISTMETLKANLGSAIDAQHAAELALGQARSQLSALESQLQTHERARMQAEQQLHPIRDALEQRRLQAQACLLQVEQCQAALAETCLDETELQSDLLPEATADQLAKTTQSLQQQITQLGPVNMAAIAELATETERKGYLDSQLTDLLTASETLEAAIQKIDRETRGKLKATFDEANRHFGELFQTLFNGGHARLELLGDEILDTGVQVFAQPPGKKNTTIQLLSGGEKALTAMALVFALFRLNPAPFCLMDEVDAPLDDSNTERFTQLVKVMSEKTQFLFVSHNKITMEMSQQLIGVTMQESGVSRIVDVDIDEAIRMHAA